MLNEEGKNIQCAVFKGFTPIRKQEMLNLFQHLLLLKKGYFGIRDAETSSA